MHLERKDIRRILLLCNIIGAMCIIVDIFNMYNGVNNNSLIMKRVIQTFRLWTWYYYFMLGGCILYYKYAIYKVISLKINCLIVAVMIFITIAYEIIMSVKISSMFTESYYDNILVTIWVINIFLLISRVIINEKYNKFIDFIDNGISGIYIIHLLVISLCGVHKYKSTSINLILVFIVFGLSLLIIKLIRHLPFGKKVTTF